VTLFEGDYHYGLGVLVNSLVRNGMRGRVIAGYRGPLPPWCSQLRRLENNPETAYRVTDDCELTFLPVDTNAHLTNYKPRFVLELLKRHRFESENVFYFDPDIVVCCRWTFFEEWVRGGVALCEDVNWRMSSDHPIRNAWREYFRQFGQLLPYKRDAYYNAGFVGTSPSHLAFFCEWEHILNECDFDRKILVGDDRTYLFKGVDQDALNITTMNTDLPLSTIGPDGMDFQPGGGGFVMSHAIGSFKPWNHSYTWAAIVKGRRLARVERLFLENANSPIQVFSRPRYWSKKLDRLVAGAVSRVLA
jgi:hypothetical protein